MSNARSQSGFTIIELIIAAAVLCVLGVMATPLLSGAAGSVRLGAEARNLSIAIAGMEERVQVNHAGPGRRASEKDAQADTLDVTAALAKGADDPATLNSLGQTLALGGHPEEALPQIERAVLLAPAKWEYRFNLAHAAGELGQWDRAVSEYREASRLAPTDYRTAFNLAMALHKKGDEAAAIPAYQKAIELAPAEASFHVSLGVSLEAAGRVSDAVAEFQRYLELAPSAPDAQPLKAHLDALASASTQAL